MIPLHDDMVISFVNYELKVRIEQKTAEEMRLQQAEMQQFFASRGVVKPSDSVSASVNRDVKNSTNPAQMTQEVGNGESVIEGLGASKEELEGAATKIGAVYRGRKARQEVAQKKAELEQSKNPDGTNQEAGEYQEQPGDQEDGAEEQE
jgi:hypothetical protein